MKVQINLIKHSGFSTFRGIPSAVRKAIALILISIFINSCSESDNFAKVCVEADDFGGGTVNKVISVDPSKPYTSSGVRVKAGDKLEMEIGGVVDLCPTVTTITPDVINPKNRLWQDTGISLQQGDKFLMTVDGGYIDSSGKEQKDGRGLYAYIGDTPPSSEECLNYWFGDPKASCGSNQPEVNKTNNTFPEFFELWNNGSVGIGGGYSGIATKSGKLWLRYARTADSTRVDNNGDDRKSPWRGVYRWEDHRCVACSDVTIATTCASVAPVAYAMYPVCVAAWVGGCKDSGHYQPDQNKCQEHPVNLDGPGGDHWVRENYSEPECKTATGKNGYCKNEGGYNLTITNGCIGTYGRFLEMHIGEAKISYAPKKSCQDLTECTEANGNVKILQPGESCTGKSDIKTICSTEMDDFNQYPISEPVYNISSPNITSLDGSPITPEGELVKFPHNSFVASGQYKGTVPSTGDLLFYIRDDRPSSNHPTAYYPDNTGTYTVALKTKKYSDGFSSLTKKIIEPIEEVLFGECKAEGYPDTMGVYKKGCPEVAWKPGIAEKMYKTFIGSNSSSSIIIDTIRALLALYVIIYGGSFMLGLVDVDRMQFAKKIVIFGIVVQLTSASSWDFFANNLFSLFIEGMNTLMVVLGGSFSGAISTVMVDPMTGEYLTDANDQLISTVNGNNIFAFADLTFSSFLNKETFIKVSSLLFTNGTGILFVAALFLSLYYLFYALIKAVVWYLLAMFALSLLFAVAPLFITFLLFERTKGLFDTWIKNIISYSLQPPMVVAMLAIFNTLCYAILYKILFFRACWESVSSITIALTDDIKFKLPFIYYFVPHGKSGFGNDVPVSFFLVMVFTILCVTVYGFMNWMGKIAANISGVGEGTSLATSSQEFMTDAVGKAQKVASLGAKVATKVTAVVAKYTILAVGSVASGGTASGFAKTAADLTAKGIEAGGDIANKVGNAGMDAATNVGTGEPASQDK